MANYVWIGNKHVNSFGSSSQFWADYYYASYRDGTKMYYRLKTRLTYKNTSGGTGYYQDNVVAIFKMNYDSTPKYDVQKIIKATTYSNFYNGQFWEAESDWFSLEKTSGNINCFISINNSNTWGFDDPDNYFSLGIIPALSTIQVNGGASFDIDIEENISNTVPVVITKYATSYTQKLRITLKNSQNVKTLIRDYADFEEGDALTFTAEELIAIYDNADKSSFVLIFDLDTYDGTTKIGSATPVEQFANLSTTGLAPTLTTTFVETNEKVIALLGESTDIIVQNASIINMEVTPVAYKKATVSQVQLIHNNMAILKTENPYNYLFNVANSIFSATVTDSRGITNDIEYTYIKNIIEYLPININKCDFKREAMTSSNVILNADIQYKQTEFGTAKNVPTIKWKLNNNDWNTLAVSDYIIDEINNKIIINNLKLDGILPHTMEGILYLTVSDLLTEDNENKEVLRGIPVFDYGEHDFQVNGTLYVADSNRENKNIVATKKDIEKNFIDLTINEMTPIISGNSNIKISFDKIRNIEGDKLSLSDGGIKIGKGISYVRFSTIMTVQNQASGFSQKRVVLYKNGNIERRGFSLANSSTYSASTVTLSGIIDVNENDILYIYVAPGINSVILPDTYLSFCAEVIK